MQLFTSISRGKTPLNLDLMSIAPLLPGADHFAQSLHRRQALIQALASQHGEFDLSHIQPTPMFGRVVELQPAGNPARLLWLECLIQRSWSMGIQIIQHDSDLWRVRKMHIDQFLHRCGKILLCPSLGDFYMPPAKIGFQEQEEIAGSFSLILIIHPFPLSRLWWQRLTYMIEHLIGALIKADAWRVRIIRLRIQIQHVFHVPDELRAYTWNAPLLLLPRLEQVFFRVRRTVSSLISPTMPTSTRRSASNCIVHFTWSLGGVLQESAIRYASPFSVSLRGTPGRGRSLSASPSPPSTYFFRVRSTVDRPTPKASTISESCLPSSAKRKIWARANVRAAMVPFLVNSRIWWRSSSLSWTTYCFFGIGRSWFFRSTLPSACLSVKFFVVEY